MITWFLTFKEDLRGKVSENRVCG